MIKLVTTVGSTTAWALNCTKEWRGDDSRVVYHNLPDFKLTGYTVVQVGEVPVEVQLAALEHVAKTTDYSAYSRAAVKHALDTLRAKIADHDAL